MDGKQLKNSILQWAIQGKLVPQNPKDEPASKLLEHIAAIRHSEQSEESSKRSKKTSKTPTSRIYRENGVWYEQVGNAEPKDISDDIPFEIPQNWAWCRLGYIGETITGSTPSKLNSHYIGSDIPFLSPGDISQFNSVISYNNQGLSNLGKSVARPVPAQTILQVCIGGSIGKSAIVDREVCFNQQINSITLKDIDYRYVYYVLQSKFFQDSIKAKATGTATPIINKSSWDRLLLPVAPLAEQKRIVAKLEQALPLADEYGAAQEQLDKLNKELPEALKKSILQQAIQGKLVPQNPKDEPAEKLLEKIRNEKEILVKQGKLKKKDLKYNPIDEDEIPFELPENWVWCRLGDIVSKLVDGDHNPPAGISKKTEYMMLSSRNINFDKLVDLDNVRYLEADVFSKENERTEATIGDVLFTSVGTIGRSCVLKEDLKICFQRSVTIMTTYVYNEYLKRFFDSPFYQNYANEHAVGTAQRGFYLKEMEQSLIALPPLAEQKRIVAKLEQLFKVL